MGQHEDIPGREAKIREAAGAMVQQRGWGLLSQAELVRRVEPLLGDDPVDNARRLLFHVYAQALHDACAGLEGEKRQRLGFEELFRYLHDAAWHIAPELLPDERAQIVDRALADIYYRLIKRPGVREPAAFLTVAAQQLRTVLHKWRCGTWVEWDKWVIDQTTLAESEPEQRAADREFRRRVRQYFERTSRRHPRAELP